MSEKSLEMTEKRPIKYPYEVTENDVAVTEDREALAATEGRAMHVESHVWAFTVDPEAEAGSETFTRGDFEAAIDKVSRPLKGRLAHVPYSSEDLIRDKRQEAELEDS